MLQVSKVKVFFKSFLVLIRLNIAEIFFIFHLKYFYNFSWRKPRESSSD